MKCSTSSLFLCYFFGSVYVAFPMYFLFGLDSVNAILSTGRPWIYDPKVKTEQDPLSFIPEIAFVITASFEQL